MMKLPESSREVMASLDAAYDQMLALSDDLWLEIEHNEDEVLSEGVELKRKLNANLVALDKVLSSFAEMAVVDEEQSEIVVEEAHPSSSKPEELEAFESLDRDFAYTSPQAFVFAGNVYKPSRSNWSKLYLDFLGLLEKRDRTVFQSLATSKRFLTNKNNRMFAAEPSKLRKAREISRGVWAETNLSANQIVGNVRELLKEFGMGESDFSVRVNRPRPLVTLESLGLA